MYTGEFLEEVAQNVYHLFVHTVFLSANRLLAEDAGLNPFVAARTPRTVLIIFVQD
jgi:hypothetical protein